MRGFLVLMILIGFFRAPEAQSLTIAPFTSDYCSSWFDGDWGDCCFTHDLSYWMGGTEEERLAADQGLNRCVHKKSALQGFVMYYGVRMGGSPNYNTTYRWGYGWPAGRGYKKLNSRELDSVIDELNRTCVLEHQQQLILDFMKKRKYPIRFIAF